MLAEAGMVREAGRSTTMGNTTYLLRPERRVGQNGYEDGLVKELADSYVAANNSLR